MTVPAQLESVTAVTKANVYFDGKVVSHTVLLPDGAKKTLGLIYPGSYHFGTGAPEIMELVAGTCRYRIDGTPDWITATAGDHFHVPGQSGFDIEVTGGICEYICSFV